MNEILAALGIKKMSILFAGAAGSMLAIWHNPSLSKIQICGIGIGGLLCSMYLTTPILSFFKLSGDEYEHGVAFIVGLFGMSIIGAITEGIKKLDLAGILKGRFGK